MLQIFIRLVTIVLVCLGLIGCSHALHQYHVSDMAAVDYSAKKHERISAEGHQPAILGFVFDTKYVDETFDRLKTQCRDGIVTGINTRYSTSHGFFHWTNKIKMTALCVKST